jgi:hypothetical protein
MLAGVPLVPGYSVMSKRRQRNYAVGGASMLAVALSPGLPVHKHERLRLVASWPVMELTKTKGVSFDHDEYGTSLSLPYGQTYQT